jgi:hypothetical protein
LDGDGPCERRCFESEFVPSLRFSKQTCGLMVMAPKPAK